MKYSKNKKIIVIFPCDLLETKRVDINFKDEWDVLDNFDVEKYAIDMDNLNSLKNLPYRNDINITIYRGWMLTDDEYLNFYNILKHKGYMLNNTPNQYNSCHYFPLAYMKSSLLRNKTPYMIYTYGKEYNFQKILSKMKHLFSMKFNSMIVKDWVKSAKDSKNSLIIKNILDKNEVNEVVSNMIKDRDMYGFNKGIVFKEFVELQKDINGNNIEWRIFIYKNNIFSVSPNGCKDDSFDKNMLNILKEISNQLKSNFLTIDVGLKIDGDWIIIETGSGEVSGISSEEDIFIFYKNFLKYLNE